MVEFECEFERVRVDGDCSGILWIKYSLGRLRGQLCTAAVTMVKFECEFELVRVDLVLGRAVERARCMAGL